MNDADKRKVEELKKSKPEFEKLYAQLDDMRGRIKGKVAVAPLQRYELAKGKTPVVWSVMENPGPAISEILRLAVLLAKFFPEVQHPRWQEVFFSHALGGPGELRQREGGGRRKGSRNKEDVGPRDLKMATEYFEGYYSKADIARRYRVSTKTVDRAIKKKGKEAQENIARRKKSHDKITQVNR